jgi:hypothetical protein
MKIKLLKDHEHYGKKYKEGDEIEVTKEEYEFLMNAYVAERKQIVEKAQKIEKTLKGVK